MSAASETRIFGIKVGVDPKWIIGGLVLLAVVVFFINTHTSDNDAGAGSANTGFHSLPTPPASIGRGRRPTRRVRATTGNDRGVLRIRPVDASRGDIDPTLRLDLLERLQNVAPAKVTRSLFELQAAAAPSLEKIKELNQTVVPAPVAPIVPVEAPKPPPPQVNIPLKFYGFVKPAGRSSVNRGLFLEGDNVVVATEGDLVDHRYLVVELTPTGARMSDTQMKQEQTLPLTPASTPQ